MDHLLPIYKPFDFRSEIYCQNMTSTEQCFLLVSEQKDVELESLAFSPELTQPGAHETSMLFFLYMEDAFYVLQKQVRLESRKGIIVPPKGVV